MSMTDRFNGLQPCVAWAIRTRAALAIGCYTLLPNVSLPIVPPAPREEARDKSPAKAPGFSHGDRLLSGNIPQSLRQPGGAIALLSVEEEGGQPRGVAPTRPGICRGRPPCLPSVSGCLPFLPPCLPSLPPCLPSLPPCPPLSFAIGNHPGQPGLKAGLAGAFRV